jgi:hypothetical protein
MGFTPDETHYKLVFDDDRYDGLEVTIRECSVGELTELAELAAAAQQASDLNKVKTVGRLFDLLGESLISWNIEDRNHNSVPATSEGVRTQTLKTVLLIVKAWMAAVAEVDIPLPEGSSDGENSLELSIPMGPS